LGPDHENRLGSAGKLTAAGQHYERWQTKAAAPRQAVLSRVEEPPGVLAHAQSSKRCVGSHARGRAGALLNVPLAPRRWAQ